MSSLISRGTSSLQDASTLHSTSNPVSPLTADIPCTEKGTDYKTLANQSLASVLGEIVKFDEKEANSTLMADTWKSVESSRGVNVYFMIDKYTKQRVMLSTTHVKCDIVDAVDYILDINTRFKYDNMVKENIELEQFDKHITFNYVSLQTKACTMNYLVDFCYLTTHREIGSKHVVAYSSILDNPYAPSTTDVRRAWLYHSGFVVEKTETEGELKIYYLLHCDLRIKDLPHSIKNSVLEKQAFILAYMKDDLTSENSRMSRFKSLSVLDPFPIERIPSNTSIDMNLEVVSTSANNTMAQYNGPIRRMQGRTYSEQSAHIDMNDVLDTPSAFDVEANNDLCFWSLDGDQDIVKTDSLECLSDYVTMGNSAAASLFREYINVLEAVRFSSVCPEKLSWKVLEKNDEVWTLEKVGGTLQCMAGVANIRASEREITDFLNDPRSRFSYDQTLYKTFVVDEINEDLRIIYAHHKARHCFIGHGRDLLYFAYNRKEGEKRILAHASCTHPKCPVDPDIVRSTMYETGFIIEPLPEENLSSVVYIVKIDIGGSYVPAGLVRWLKRKQPSILFEIKKYFER